MWIACLGLGSLAAIHMDSHGDYSAVLNLDGWIAGWIAKPTRLFRCIFNLKNTS